MLAASLAPIRFRTPSARQSAARDPIRCTAVSKPPRKVVATRKEETMFRLFRNWVQNQKQTRRFHPSWILLVVVVTVVVAGIIWIPAELIARAEHDDRPPAAKLPVGGESALPREEIPRRYPWNLAFGIASRS